VNSAQAEQLALHDCGVECVHRLVEAQAATTPEAIAVIDGESRVSYRELMARSNQLAHALRAAGVTSGARVGVCCERGAGMIVAVLGVLGAGAAYVPIDPAYSRARVELVVADARLAAVVVSPALAVRFTGLAVRAIRLDELAGFPVAPPEVAATAGAAMYVLYTSGSTGQPKGVIGLHAAIVNRLRWQHDAYPYEPGEVASARTALGFVDSVAEIFAPLAFGVPLVVLGDAAQRDPSRAIAELAAAGATRIVVVPSLLAALLDAVPDVARRAPRLRWWFVGGEPVPVALVERFARALPGRKLINIYGATELSGDATWFDFDRMPSGLTSSPIGAPLRGVWARIVDGELREVADGEPGEICVSGACVAPGYLDRPELTASRFVANPFPEGGALYRTRDLGRRLPGGDLQYLGRIDQLVKIRGHRVELGEVEAIVGALPGVAHAVAIARGDQLIAFYTGERAIAPGEVRAHVAAHAPEAVVPNLCIQLDGFPRNASGKVDRGALAALAVRPGAPADPGPLPRGDDERLVAAVWEAVLDRAPIGRAQSFHDLGGSSLAAMRIVARLRDHHAIDLPVAAIYEAPTVAELAARLGARRPRAARPAIAISGRALPPALPLSHHQVPYWLFRALTADVSVVAEVFAMSRPVDVERLQAAFSDTVAAFDTLWMRYPRWRPIQCPAPRRPVRFAVRDHRDRADAAALARESDANTVQRFDLERPPHVHARLVRLRDGDRLLVAMPHIAVDMAAMELFRRGLLARYTGADAAAPRAAGLLDVIEWERAGPRRPDDARYWHGIGRRAAWNAMPARLFTSKRAGRRVRAWTQRVLPDALAGALAAHARRHATSVPIALIGAIHAALARIVVTGDPALLVMIDKRDRAELRDVFANLTAVMACHIGDARGPVAGVAARVARQLVASAERSDGVMRRPTLWNDLWAHAPAPAVALVRALSARLARRWPDARLDPEVLAEYVFAIVPPPGRRGGDRRILIAVNILPEVARDAPRATGEFAITHERELPLMLRPGDLVVGSDPVLDRALQIHVARDARGIVVNLYGGAIDPAGLDELGDAIVTALDELVAARAPPAGASERVA
jgi:amino acid adenylation domain-containing protein